MVCTWIVFHWLMCLNTWSLADGRCFGRSWNLRGGFSGRTGLSPLACHLTFSALLLPDCRENVMTDLSSYHQALPTGVDEPKKPSPLTLSLVSNEKHNQQRLYYTHWWKAETVKVFRSNIPWEEGGKGWMKGRCFCYEPVSLIWLLTVLQVSFGSAS